MKFENFTVFSRHIYEQFCVPCEKNKTVFFIELWLTDSPSLQFVLTAALRDLYIYKDFVWELLDRVIYKTL